MESKTTWIVLAHLLRPQGRKGEVLAELFTDFPERFAERPRVWLAAPGFAGTLTDAEAAQVAGYWLPVGRNAGRVVLHFSGIDSIEAAERIEGKDVIVPQAERLPLDEDAAYISDLVGCVVFDGETAVGVVADVQFPVTADGARRLEDAAPLLAVTSSDGDEVLVPFVKAFLVELDIAGKAIRMALPEGLVGVNR